MDAVFAKHGCDTVDVHQLKGQHVEHQSGPVLEGDMSEGRPGAERTNQFKSDQHRVKMKNGGDVDEQKKDEAYGEVTFDVFKRTIAHTATDQLPTGA